MTVLPWPDHLLNLQEWDTLPEDNRFHVEVVEGVLLTSPRPVYFHQRAVVRLAHVIETQLPPRLSAAAEIDVVIEEHPLTVRSPDVVVTTAKVAERNPARIASHDVLLAIEVLSEGSVRTDRVTKFAEYAESSITHYWIVDLTRPVTLLTYRLIDGAYETFGEHTTTTTLDIDGTPVTIDLDALITPRGQSL